MAFQVLNTALTILLILCTVLLYLDARGKREALAAWQLLVDTRLDNHNGRLVVLEGGPGTPPPMARSAAGGSSGTYPSVPPPPGEAPPPRSAPRAAVGFSRPFQPSAEQVAEAREVHDGHESGWHEAAPGAVDRWEKQGIRARAEAAEDERERARKVRLEAAAQEAAARAVAKIDGAEVDEVRATIEIPADELPPKAPRERDVSPGDRASDDDATSFFSAGDRPTMFGLGLSADAAPAAPVRRDTLTPTEPSMQPLDAKIRRQWGELVAAAQEAGKDARHCHGSVCFKEGQSVTACECRCAGCVLVERLLIQAREEVIGEDW